MAENSEDIQTKIEEAKTALNSYLELYDNVYCICHHRDHASINYNNYHFVFGEHAENFIYAINELYALRTNLLHESTTIFHNLYMHLLCSGYNEVVVYRLLNVFKSLSWVVTNCYNILDNIDNNPYVKIAPGLTEIKSNEIEAHYNSNIDFNSISTMELMAKISELYGYIFEVYENKFKPNFENTWKMAEKRYGWINSIHNLYKFVLNQIEYLAQVAFRNSQRMDSIIGKDVMRVQEYVRPMLTIKYLNCLNFVKMLEALNKSVVDIGFSIDNEDLEGEGVKTPESDQKQDLVEEVKE